MACTDFFEASVASGTGEPAFPFASRTLIVFGNVKYVLFGDNTCRFAATTAHNASSFCKDCNPVR